MNPREYLKAIVGALIAGLTAVQGALPGGITPSEWIVVVIAAAVAFGGVYGVTNDSPIVEESEDVVG